jgi:hypothetical protein
MTSRPRRSLLFPSFRMPLLRARHVAQDNPQADGCQEGARLASRAMSTSELLACLIGVFFGLVAASLLIAVLG